VIAIDAANRSVKIKGVVPRSKHRRKGKMRNPSARAAMILASARGHEILGAQVAVVEQRLRQTVGATRPWTDDDYTRTANELLREGILDSRAVMPKLLPELTIID
jgi:hypothetical protein